MTQINSILVHVAAGLVVVSLVLALLRLFFPPKDKDRLVAALTAELRKCREDKDFYRDRWVKARAEAAKVGKSTDD